MFRGLSLALLLALAMSLSADVPALAADPSPALTPGPSPVLVDPLDPRAGAGANRVGAPLAALVVVVGIGALTIGATVLFVRISRRT